MFEINLIKNRILNLFQKINILKNILHYKKKINELKKIESILQKPNLWKNPKYAQKINKKQSSLSSIINIIKKITKKLKKINEIIKSYKKENNQNSLLISKITKKLNTLETEIKKIEFLRMFYGKHDKENCYIDIQAGSGGIEAQDWAKILLKMYLRWAENHNFKTEIIEEITGEITGIKSATIKIIGEYSYGWLHTETGIHRLVRKSPFDSNKKRHTSFSSVFVYPEINDEINIKIDPENLRIDVYRSSGAGGQHVNRVESAVRITHLPTNTVTQCQNERSQHKNKSQAMKQLKIKLYKLEIKKKQEEKKILENKKSEISWGRQIRSYILDDSRIKDLRTGIETRNVQMILNGNLDELIKANLENKLLRKNKYARNT
ncbi:Peptide chain release factor 2 [Candidatus Westeberhardia cardiocondylae]|uniref:Peptide chain release factor 2 n=1 Tax=Candidatus Westeberhardia cardiocondylae TaxID=1594731 RepID=A0A0H5BX65_9ENTR|nr:peptide chain release factor 2 [Candidatus Westeberhardia cardiocondylae]MCR3756320.1 peptide chain release factor RF2 [Candidatus Westeberhardia cardiocondylae]CEN32298.1 Peptide chain release factor 2 [Candidatus Westeberhardia cardiocondylae]